jgi:prevent-host-death family protein
MFKKKSLVDVVACDYIAAMKKKLTPVVYEISKKGTTPDVLKEAVSLPGVGLTFPVRTAKAKLSALLELVAAGREITITSDGEPKAVLSPVHRRQRKVFTGTWEHLKKMPVQKEGPWAEEIIRADRDGRGW